MKRPSYAACAVAFLIFAFGKMAAQNLPAEMHFSPDGKRLITGGNVVSGFYDETSLSTIELIFSQSNYWTLLTSNYQSGTDLGAIMVLNGDTLASQVGVRFKGQTSYSQIQNSQKKSFNITLDYADPDQDIEGYQTLNLNNCYEDPSFMREVLYLHESRKHTQSLKGNYVQLYINGQYWGPYANVQALDGSFTKEWFMSNDGTRWRALKTIGGGGGPGGGGTGGPFGTGYCTLNWLGTSDSTEYKKYYTLKKTSKANPWEDLIQVCDKLNNTPLATLEDTLRNYMDIDRTLWFLATEIAFGDDDSYVWKGGMDYYLYWEPETDRLVPIEYDGNSNMLSMTASWSPFYNQTDTRFPLMNRLFAVPALRQRYLAHLRTIMEDGLTESEINGQIDTYFDLIDPYVSSDTKKIYSYQQFVSDVASLKNLYQTRRTTVLGNTEVQQQGPVVESAVMSSANGTWTSPDAGEVANITAVIGAGSAVSGVYLHYGGGVVGNFTKTQMFDDGAHNDGAAGDGVFGAEIPGFGNGEYVRFYIEALANNAAKTATYFPKGAEYDVFVYKIGVTAYFDSPVVVNEIMASNESTQADQDGEFDDWVELYNNSTDAVDLSGWHLTDNFSNLAKWTFPDGTTIPGNGYLIVWADEDGSQAGLHANFKLSGSGEAVYLLDADQRIGQEVVFGQQETDMGYARVPNGTGDFIIKAPTFNANNETGLSAATDIAQKNQFNLYPNPATAQVTLRSTTAALGHVQVCNALGQVMLERDAQLASKIDISAWQSGVYWVKTDLGTKRLMVAN